MPKRDPLGLIGEKLNRYRIEEFAGRGGMSVVYHARHEIGDYVVAVKVLDPELADDPKVVRSFLAEARNTAALRHPSIIRVNDVDQTEEGWAYLVMEWLDGRTLYDELEERSYGLRGMTCMVALTDCKRTRSRTTSAFRDSMKTRRSGCSITGFGITILNSEDMSPRTRSGPQED